MIYAMTNHPHRLECRGPRSGVSRVRACALPALRIQVCWTAAWCEHSLLHSGAERPREQMSLLERLDWRVSVQFFTAIYLIIDRFCIGVFKLARVCRTRSLKILTTIIKSNSLIIIAQLHELLSSGAKLNYLIPESNYLNICHALLYFIISPQALYHHVQFS